MSLFSKIITGGEDVAPATGLAALVSKVRDLTIDSTLDSLAVESFRGRPLSQGVDGEGLAGLGRIYSQLRNGLAGVQDVGFTHTGDAALAMESITGTAMQRISTDAEENKVGFAAAALAAAMTCSVESLRSYANTVNTPIQPRRANPNETLVVITSPSTGDVVDRTDLSALSVESYDESARITTSVFSQIFALNKGGQEPGLEKWFPTVLVPVNEAGYSVSIPLIEVMNDRKHLLEAKQADFNFRHIAHAYIDPDLLRDDTTRLVPVYRDEYKSWFVPDSEFAPYNVELDGRQVPTSAVKFGEEVNLIAICQTAAFLETGTADIGTSIDPGLHMDSVLMKVGAETIKVSVRELNGSNFWAPPQGLNRQETIMFDSKAVQLRGEILQGDGTPSVELKAIADQGVTVRLGMTVSGSVMLDTGESTLTAGRVRVIAVTRAGTQVALDDPTVAALVAKLNSATLTGWFPDGYLANADVRQRGQLINTRIYSQMYPVKKRSPISAIRSHVVAGTTTEATDLNNLLAACSIRMTNSAIDTIVRHEALLNNVYDKDIPVTEAVRQVGIAHHLVGMYHRREVIDMEAELMTRNSQDKTKDMQAVLANRLREFFICAYTTTGYGPAAALILNNPNARPVALVLTDPIIANYILLHGDPRTLGNGFELDVCVTFNKRVRGKMYASFGLREAMNSGQPNSMHVGSAGFKPETVVELPTVVNGANHKQITVNPNYEHNINLPILGMFEVVNIPESVIKRTPMLMYTKSLDEDVGGGGQTDPGTDQGGTGD